MWDSQNTIIENLARVMCPISFAAKERKHGEIDHNDIKFLARDGANACKEPHRQRESSPIVLDGFRYNAMSDTHIRRGGPAKYAYNLLSGPLSWQDEVNCSPMPGDGWWSLTSSTRATPCRSRVAALALCTLAAQDFGSV